MAAVYYNIYSWPWHILSDKELSFDNISLIDIDVLLETLVPQR